MPSTGGRQRHIIGMIISTSTSINDSMTSADSQMAMPSQPVSHGLCYGEMPGVCSMPANEATLGSHHCIKDPKQATFKEDAVE